MQPFGYLKQWWQSVLSGILGLPPEWKTFEKRLTRVEAELIVLKGKVESNRCRVFIVPLTPLDQYEEEMTHLEKIFSTFSDRFSRIPWYQITNDGPSEHFRLANGF
jgi:hypothetical protein